MHKKPMAEWTAAGSAIFSYMESAAAADDMEALTAVQEAIGANGALLPFEADALGGWVARYIDDLRRDASRWRPTPT